ncbi:MAG: pseudouridine-5'-phosphate glycosidase [Anaerolineae bacterium]|nr:pseudouridine-5'-phosphate glycosidase [Anaerolineae bacterium]
MASPASWVRIAPQVERALADGRPVVALESTLISHGLPYPQNLETAQLLEATVRAHGALPATIAVLGGVPRAGLSADDLARLATAADVRKVSRRDLPVVVAQGVDGATTVAATMIIAAAAGIEVFATGGIGGVHRGQPFDISADLPELAATPVVVVCAGAKAILDLPLTMEWLETHGVPVLGYGTDTLPAFYTLSSGLPVDARVDTPAQAAAIVRAKRRMGLRGGVLVTVPAPPEEALPRQAAEEAIEAALREAEARGVHGKETTPYLLAQIAERTGGESIRANIALLRNNAAVAAQIAAALAHPA